ncbi:calcium-independent phospholipase A2-gamma [Galendromus occidentalis]|uniref:Calcium-independent phospholipase A2-gamma n=1 Tax=Galendromus occidentalis TaxID=34638 RepID=A0AAJ6QUA9_9ACAR|nr:calcium-independent phospholipase A2-gamma [Galendromus occidentalis]
MSGALRFVRLKRLQRSFVGSLLMNPSRMTMSTVKIPRKLYESALQAWSTLVEGTNNQWRRVLARDQVSRLQPRLGVQQDSETEKSSRPLEGITSEAGQADTRGHDVLRDNVLERAFREEQQQAAASKAAQSSAKGPRPTVKEITKELRQAEQNRLRSVDDIDARSRHLIREIQGADLPCALAKRLEEFSEHILLYPNSRATLINDKALSVLLKIRRKSHDENVLGLTRECLSLLGYVQPPNSAGVRILSIDGGGVRGLLVIEVLRQLEKCTGKKISELFDYVVGVSTGAILVGILTTLQKDLDVCDDLYRNMSSTVFQQSSWWGTGKLVWNHAYYDTSQWQDILKQLYGDVRLYHSSRNENVPKVGILSAVVNKQQLVPFLFRNYQLPPKEESFYAGSCSPHVWQAVRASSSAPFYFEEFDFNGDVHQDGGIIQNNPTAAAIHESRLLWPDEEIQCVVSIGSGRYIPEEAEIVAKSTSLKTKIMKIVDSATDTEAVHTLCNDLLKPGTYYRFNPYLSEPFTLDETRPEKMDRLRLDAQMYLRRNDRKFVHAADRLVQPRSLAQKCRDLLKDNIQERLV